MTEPRFVIRAQDRLAPDAIAAYSRACKAHGLTAQAEQVDLALEEVLAWQLQNPGAVKDPDHAHVPADAADPLREPQSEWTSKQE